jgi:hypothetical protein
MTALTSSVHMLVPILDPLSAMLPDTRRGIAWQVSRGLGRTSRQKQQVLYFSLCSYCGLRGRRSTGVRSVRTLGPPSRKRAVRVYFGPCVLFRRQTVDHSTKNGADGVYLPSFHA